MRIGPDVQLLEKLRGGWHLGAVATGVVSWMVLIGLLV
jgi:hypothetical protein